MHLIPWQAQAIKGLLDPNGPRLTSVYGGIGVGKSLWIAQVIFAVAWTRPGARVVLSADTLTRLLTTNKPHCDQVFGHLAEWKGSGGPAGYTFPNGSTVRFIGYTLPSGRDEARNAWEGNDLHLLICDEIQMLPSAAFGHSFARTRQNVKDYAGIEHKPKLIWCGRPGAVTHWVDETEKLETQGIKTAIYRPMTRDNPYLPAEYLEGLRAIYSEQEYLCHTTGAPMPTTGAIYSGLSTANYPEGNMYEFPGGAAGVPKDHPTMLGLDFGYTNPAVVFIQSHMVQGQMRDIVVDEVRGVNMLTPQLIKAVLAKGYTDLSVCVVDPAGGNTNVQTGISDIQLLRKPTDDEGFLGGGLGCPIQWTRVPARTSIAAGISRVQALICDANGVRRLLFARHLFYPEPGQAQTPHGIAESMLTYAFGPDGLPKKGARGNQADHSADALRYWVIFCRWLGESVGQGGSAGTSTPRTQAQTSTIPRAQPGRSSRVPRGR